MSADHPSSDPSAHPRSLAGPSATGSEVVEREARTTSFTQRFAAEHPHLQGKRITLFAPTFRGRSYHTASYDYDLIDLDALYDACPPDTVVLFRMHHFVKESIEIPEKYRDRFFDFTRFPDGLGLLHVTDLLITDYSSIIYEFALLDRPMLFFAPDRAVYAATRDSTATTRRRRPVASARPSTRWSARSGRVTSSRRSWRASARRTSTESTRGLQIG